MDEQFSIKLATIQNDLSRIEGILTARLVNAILNKTTSTLDRDAVLRYKSARLWHHRNGWLWHAVMKVFMPVRMMRRSMFGKGSTTTIRAVLYALFLEFVWAICILEYPFQKSLFGIVWTLVVLGFIGPYFIALMALLKNKVLYAGVKATFSGVKYYGE